MQLQWKLKDQMHLLNNQRVDIHRLLKAFACKKCEKYKDNFFSQKKK